MSFIALASGPAFWILQPSILCFWCKYFNVYILSLLFGFPQRTSWWTKLSRFIHQSGISGYSVILGEFSSQLSKLNFIKKPLRTPCFILLEAILLPLCRQKHLTLATGHPKNILMLLWRYHPEIFTPTLTEKNHQVLKPMGPWAWPSLEGTIKFILEDSEVSETLALRMTWGFNQVGCW